MSILILNRLKQPQAGSFDSILLPDKQVTFTRKYRNQYQPHFLFAGYLKYPI